MEFPARTDVFILGSGFSRALSRVMPTTRGLADKLERHLRLVEGDRVPLVSLLGANGDDVEALLGYLAEDQPWQNDAVNLRNRGALADVLLFLANTLWSAQQMALDEPMPEVLQSLIRRWHADRTKVITFNYDTLVEAALNDLATELGLPRNYAHPGLSTLDLPELSERHAKHGFSFGRPMGDTFALLKLHGSLNWLYSGEHGGYGDVMYESGQVGSWHSRNSTSLQGILDAAPGLEVALLPPTPTKFGMMANGMLRALWQRAANAIITAERIIVIGYSVPQSDRVVRGMLSVMAMPSDLMKREIIPVNISTDIVAVCRAIFRDCEVVEDYCGDHLALDRFVADYCETS